MCCDSPNAECGGSPRTCCAQARGGSWTSCWASGSGGTPPLGSSCGRAPHGACTCTRPQKSLRWHQCPVCERAQWSQVWTAGRQAPCDRHHTPLATSIQLRPRSEVLATQYSKSIASFDTWNKKLIQFLHR